MNIDEILKELKQLEISKDEFYVEENAALVIRGIMNETDNIKICMSSDAIKTLENTHKLTAKDSKHYILGKLHIRECKKSSFDMEKHEPYNIESICKRLYILLELNNEAQLIKKIKEYVGPSFLYVNNIEEYEIEKKNGANLEEIDSRGETPLFRAVRNDNIALVNRMLDDGANINTLNSKGCNLGFFCNSLDMIKLLIEKGLKYNTKDHKGNTILDYVVNNEIKEYLHNL
ncbi:MAG: hypothetical protein K6B70_00435 [Clostridia bacterium]|nr:hypothetical protein [Clostridia bacterium]